MNTNSFTILTYTRVFIHNEPRNHPHVKITWLKFFPFHYDKLFINHLFLFVLNISFLTSSPTCDNSIGIWQGLFSKILLLCMDSTKARKTQKFYLAKLPAATFRTNCTTRKKKASAQPQQLTFPGFNCLCLPISYIFYLPPFFQHTRYFNSASWLLLLSFVKP